MEGQRLSHYEIQEKLGGGGMGVVYKALDTRLNRHVALKFLPPEFTRDDDARLRFTQEAQAASALDHPNICTIYEIDSTVDGQMFIAMSYYAGSTLKQRVAEGPLDVAEALDVAAQIARGLIKAHDAGIVHRDIKSANVMLTPDGLVKIVDFGIAKLLGVTGPTQSESTLGTVSYMAPEQVAGEDADPQSDLWSLGAVTYELLTGRPPFRGENPWAVMAAVTNQEVDPPSAITEGVPEDLDSFIFQALAKDKAERFASATEFLRAAESCHRAITAPHPQAPGAGASRMGTPARAAAAVAFLAVTSAAIWSLARDAGNDVGPETIVEIQQLAEAGNYPAALDLGLRALEVAPELPELEELIDAVSVIPSIETEPPGARVSMREYANADGPWIEVGVTPLTEARVPLGFKRWKIEMEGFEPADLALPPQRPTSFTLQPTGSIPEGMVLVSGGVAGGFITGIGPLEPLPYADYFIDRYEVTNEAYLEFVAAGGYEREEFWREDFMDGDQELTWSAAMERFEDATGLPGPATWELGRPQSGQETFPVTGVSWYEAAAYAEFRGKSLPTLRHWVQAAGTPQGGSIIPLSNLAGDAPTVPGTFSGMSSFGSYDMAGNVREWLLNSAGNQRHAVGGAWSDPTYFFSGPSVQSPFDRLPTNGLRLAQYTQQDDFEGEATVDMPLLTRDYSVDQPVSDEVFSVFAAQFDYDPTPLNAEVEETFDYDQGTIERVSFDGVGWGRIHAYLYLPARAEPPYQTVVWFPGSGAARLQPEPNPSEVGNLQHFVAGGRAVIWPIVRSTFSRALPDQPPNMNLTWPQGTRDYVDLIHSWVSEVRRSIDYLESRPEIDAEKIAYHGFSWGGRLGAIIPAVEPRFKLNMVMIGGLASGTALPEADQINYVTRVTIPTLMLNGRHDPLEPVESAQLPMLELLGTPEADKRHVIYEGYGHNLPPNEHARETLDWLDRYFGEPR